MSKVFIVRFHVIQFTRYSSRSALAVSFYILAHRFQIVKHFFQVFSIFFAVSYFFAALADSFSIISDPLLFVNTFFHLFSKFFHKKGASIEAPCLRLYFITPRRQSDRSRHHFCGRQPRKNRHCLHHGMQRSCDPADSSAAPLLPVSWV